MELLTFTIAAGETKRFERPGRYFEIIDSQIPINVELTGPNGERADDMRAAVSGMFAEGQFSGFEIENGPASQALTLMITDGRGGSRRQPGTVLVTYPIGSSVQLIDAIDTAPSVGFNIARTLIAPAANLRGVRIHSVRLGVTANAAGTTDLRLLAAPSAPSSVSQPQQWAGAAVSAANGATATDNQQRMNVTIPAGWGLYLCAQNTGAVPPTTVYSSTCLEVVP